ncbi:hypothetical protein F8154_05860 [Alkaliphilus pronyensis]|uniref:Uncharacterized protein n=1 Tax=Alkaliphilus pronyensis TaxID=1482732 RepID=A0A6I0FAU2_9FIRM|nr:hypothetical protein [Alkaliphilus pronyensis]KAB3535656.1 hypothetical protein F8154_05860 [Alkaliphilus pronyensis]
MKIQGLSKLTEEQKRHMFNVHKNHVACNGYERKMNMKIVKVWIDKNNTICVRLANGEWYHYYSNGTWG